MSSTVTLSAAVRANLLALQNTASQLAITQGRLATQKKVNSALDNPTNFFTSTALDSRANELSNLLNSMNNGVNTLKAADTGLTSITATIQSMQATVTQARQDSNWQSTSFTLDTVTIGTASVKNISFSLGATVSSPNVALQSGSAGTAATLSTQASWSAVTPAARSPVLTAANNFNPAGLDMTTGDETYAFNVTDAAGAHAVSLTTADNTGGGTTLSMAEVVAGINNDLSATNVRVRDNAGKLEFYMNNGATGAGQSLTLSGFATGGTTPTAMTLATVGFAGTETQAGVNAQTYTITIGDGTTTKTITLDGTVPGNADTIAQAVATTNTGLGLNNTFQAYDNGGKLGIREVSNNGATLTIAGASATTLFGGTLTNTGSAGTLTVKSVDQLVTDINSAYSGAVKASNDNGNLQIQNLSTSSLTVTGGHGTTIDGSSTATIGGNSARNNLITQFNLLRDQLDKTAADSSFNGLNLLQGDSLKLFFNEKSTSSLTIVSTAATGINNTQLGIGTGTATQFQNNTSLDTLLATLHTALGTVASQSSAFGSNLTIVNNRQDFTKNLINTLQAGSSALTLADTNEEGANMLALQTRQQLAITSLSLASQSNQAVLRLFG